MRTVEDAVLAVKVRDELCDVMALVGRFLRISVSHGIVAVSGVVPSEIARRTAVAIITRVPGVFEVRDQVTVGRP